MITVPLPRRDGTIEPYDLGHFQEPTSHYKTGPVFLAYLNGHQRHFRMVGGQEGFRSIIHLAGLVRLADTAGLFTEPEEVARRLRAVLATAGLV